MAVLLGEDAQTPSGTVTVPTNTETLVAVGFPISLPSGNAKAVVRAWMDFTPGTGVNSVTLSIYEGADITGRLVGTKTPDAGDFTPGKTAHFSLEVIDRLQDVGGAQYCFSVTQAGATGDGTVVAALLGTTLLSG